MSDIVRVLRVVEYVGPREWVEETVGRSIHGQREINVGKYIRAATLGTYPEAIDPRVPCPSYVTAQDDQDF